MFSIGNLCGASGSHLVHERNDDEKLTSILVFFFPLV